MRIVFRNAKVRILYGEDFIINRSGISIRETDSLTDDITHYSWDEISHIEAITKIRISKKLSDEEIRKMIDASKNQKVTLMPCEPGRYEKIELHTSGHCPYCGTKIIREESNNGENEGTYSETGKAKGKRADY